MRGLRLDTLVPVTANPSPSGMRKDSFMRKRFEYVRMTGPEFKADLAEIQMSVKAFARITGSIAERVQKWVHSEEDIPSWVPVLTAVLKNSPGALGAARQAAAERIRLDLANPNLGEFPYLAKEDPDEPD